MNKKIKKYNKNIRILKITNNKIFNFAFENIYAYYSNLQYVSDSNLYNYNSNSNQNIILDNKNNNSVK